jgi:aminoglycoside phosphotransferase (APT) family kinase protein
VLTDFPDAQRAAVAAWMDGEGLGTGPLENVEPIVGGTQNLMVRFVRDRRPYVLRRGPMHLRPRSNDAIARERRVLDALHDTAVPHPRLIASCPDPGVLDGAVFYLMEPVDGFNAGVALPALHAGDAGIRHEMGLRIVDALAELAAVDHEQVGLADFGKPDGFLERQVPRWLAELSSYAELPGYVGPDIGPTDSIAGWLDERRPSTFAPGIMHGDYHGSNVMFSPIGPDVVAVVDWEMCTIGDPLLDLGWLLATWQLPGAPDEFAGALVKAGGLATGDEMFARYASRSTRDLSAITWYTVLACFKLGIVLEGSNARAMAGQAPAEIGDRLHTTACRLLDRAQTLMEGSP